MSDDVSQSRARRLRDSATKRRLWAAAVDVEPCSPPGLELEITPKGDALRVALDVLSGAEPAGSGTFQWPKASCTDAELAANSVLARSSCSVGQGAKPLYKAPVPPGPLPDKPLACSLEGPGQDKSLPVIGTRVTVITQKAELIGTVRFAGLTTFAEGSWIGVELDGPWGKNDGAVLGTRYFACSALHGIFARCNMVKVLTSPRQVPGEKRKSKVKSSRQKVHSADGVLQARKPSLDKSSEAEEADAGVLQRQQVQIQKQLRLQQRQATLETQRQGLSELQGILDALREENDRLRCENEHLRCKEQEYAAVKPLITSLQEDNNKLSVENMHLSVQCRETHALREAIEGLKSENESLLRSEEQLMQVQAEATQCWKKLASKDVELAEACKQVAKFQRETGRIASLEAELGKARKATAALHNDIGLHLQQISQLTSENQACEALRTAFTEQAAVKREAEEKAATEAAAKKEAEEKAAAEVAARKRAEKTAAAEAAGRKEAEEKVAAEIAARKQAEEKAAAEAAAKKEAEEKAAAEIAARKQAEEKAAAEAAGRKEAEEKAAAEVAARKQAEEKTAAETAAKKEAEEKVAAEVAARKQAEEKTAAEAAAKKKAEERAVAEVAARKRAEKTAAVEAAAKKEAEEKAAAEIAARKQAEEKTAVEAAAKKEPEEKAAAEVAATKEAQETAATEAAAKKDAKEKDAAEGAARRELEEKAATGVAGKKDAEENVAAEVATKREAEEKTAAEAAAKRGAKEKAAADAGAKKEVQDVVLAEASAMKDAEESAAREIVGKEAPEDKAKPMHIVEATRSQKAASESLAREPEARKRCLANVDDSRRQVYQGLLDILSGNAGVRECSRTLQLHVKEHLSTGQVTNHQDRIYNGIGVDNLLQNAEHVKPFFDMLARQLADTLSRSCKSPCHFLDMPVKSKGSAEDKLLLKSGETVSTITDAVRGTLVVEATHKDVLPRMYNFLQAAVVKTESDTSKEIHALMKEAGAQVQHFEDRYVHPVGNQHYWLLLIRLMGFTAELRLNLDAAISMEDYMSCKLDGMQERQSVLTLKCARKNDWQALQEVLAADADAHVPQIHDVLGMTPLHYAAFHGNEVFTHELLERSADPTAEDADGWLPVQRAITRKHSKVISCLVDAMSARSRSLSVLPDARKKGLLLAWACARDQGCSCENRLRELIKCAIPAADDQLHFAARAGLEEICRVLATHGGNINSHVFRADANLAVSVLDEAVLSGHCRAAAAIVELGGRFKPDGPHMNPKDAAQMYVACDRGLELAALLTVNAGRPMHCSDPWGKQQASGERVSALTLASSDVHPWGEANGTPLDLSGLVAIAVRHQSFRSLQVLVEHGLHLLTDAVADAGHAVSLAASGGEVDRLELLLKAKASAGNKDEQSNSPLHLAALAGSQEACYLLLKAGADINQRDGSGRTPAYLAAREGRVNVLLDLVAAGADLQLSDALVSVPAHAAAQKGHVQVLEVLKAANVDFQQTNLNGATVAFVAALHGHVQVVEYLAGEGMDIMQPTNDGTTPLFAAAQRGHVQVLELLVRHCTVDLQQSDRYGSQLVHIAASAGHVPVLEFLAAAGADLGQRDAKGATPAFLAAKSGQLPVLDFIKWAGADLQEPDGGGTKPATIAAEKGHVPVLQFLKGAGVDLDVASHLACVAAEFGHVQVLQFLRRELGADLRQAEENGWTPAHHAALAGHLHVLTFLKEMRVDLNATTRKGGNTLPHLAAETGQLHVLEFLKDSGVDLGVRREDGQIPLSIAEKHGHKACAKFLRKLKTVLSTENDEFSAFNSLRTDDFSGELSDKVFMRRGAAVLSLSEQ